MNATITKLFDDVRDSLQSAKLIAFDGCHKIYLAMDDIQAKWFTENYDHTFVGSPDEMFATIRTWWDESCGLRFIQAVSHNEEDSNAGYVSLIPQFTGDDVVDEDEEQ